MAAYGPDGLAVADHTRSDRDSGTRKHDDSEGRREPGHLRREPNEGWPREKPDVAGRGDRGERVARRDASRPARRAEQHRDEIGDAQPDHAEPNDREDRPLHDQREAEAT